MMYHKLMFIVRSCSAFGTITRQVARNNYVLKEIGSESQIVGIATAVLQNLAK